MELIAAIPVVGGVLSVIIPFLVVLGIVVFIHEYGHYIVGRWCGIHSDVFSIGFGPKLLGWTDKRGTHWQLAALPLGGYVRFVGDMDPASAGKADDSALTPEERLHAFHNAALWKRTLTVAAGPMFNFILSFVIFTALALSVGKGSPEPLIGSVDESAEIGQQIPFEPGDRVLTVDGEPVTAFYEIVNALVRANGREIPVTVLREGQEMTLPVIYRQAARVDFANPGMPASRAGIVMGDIIVAIDGKPVGSFFELQTIASAKPLGQAMVIDLLRDGEPFSVTVMPEVQERPHPVTGEVEPLPTIGIRADGIGGINPVLVEATLVEAMTGGMAQMTGIVSNTVNYLGDLVFADADTSQLSGPVRIAMISGEKADEGFKSFMFLIAVISTSIGLLNLFPIPVLDGGHLMFYLLEAVRGRPAEDFLIKVSTVVGLSLVLLLMVFATYNDLIRL